MVAPRVHTSKSDISSDVSRDRQNRTARLNNLETENPAAAATKQPNKKSNLNYILSKPPSMERQRSAGPSRLHNRQPDQSLPASRSPSASIPPSPRYNGPEDHWDPYKPASPTPEPQRSGPADPEELENATATIKLLYEHDKKLVDSIAKLKERTSFIRSKSAALRETVRKQKGIRVRIERYIMFWKPIDPTWSLRDWYGDKPFRARPEGNWIHVLDDDEESVQEEPLPPDAMPTLVREQNGAFPSLESHLAKYAHLRSDDLSDPAQAHFPRDSDTRDDNHASSGTEIALTNPSLTMGIAPSELPNTSEVNRNGKRPISSNVTMLDNNAPSELPNTSEVNRNGKRPISSVLDHESHEAQVIGPHDGIHVPPLKRQITGRPSPSSPSANHVITITGEQDTSPPGRRSESFQDKIDRQSVVMMLSQEADENEDATATSPVPVSATASTGPRILTLSEMHPAPIAAVEDVPETGVEEEDDRLAPLPHNSQSISTRMVEQGEDNTPAPLIVAKPASQRRKRSVSVQPVRLRPNTRRSTRSASRGLN